MLLCFLIHCTPEHAEPPGLVFQGESFSTSSYQPIGYRFEYRRRRRHGRPVVDEPWAQIEVKRHSAFCRQSVELIDFEAGDPFNDTSFIISVRRVFSSHPCIDPAP